MPVTFEAHLKRWHEMQSKVGSFPMAQAQRLNQRYRRQAAYDGPDMAAKGDCMPFTFEAQLKRTHQFVHLHFILPVPHLSLCPRI